MQFHRACLFSVAVCTFWFLSVIIAPYLFEPGTIRLGESGRVGADDFEFRGEPYGVFIYESGDALCHQKNSRSFVLNGNQMPYCARCIGIFLGLMLGAFLTLFYAELRWQWIIAGLAPIGVDGTGQLLGLWESFNVIRLLTGALAGAVTAIAIGVLIIELQGLIREHCPSNRS